MESEMKLVFDPVKQQLGRRGTPQGRWSRRAKSSTNDLECRESFSTSHQPEPALR
jgi:hypothetical protein